MDHDTAIALIAAPIYVDLMRHDVGGIFGYEGCRVKAIREAQALLNTVRRMLDDRHG